MSTRPDPLTALLHRADPAAELPASSPAVFAAAVHTRLRTAPTSSFAARLARQSLPLAAALALLASLGGASVAYAQESRARSAARATAFAQSIDPWLMHGSPLASLEARP